MQIIRVRRYFHIFAAIDFRNVLEVEIGVGFAYLGVVFVELGVLPHDCKQRGKPVFFKKRHRFC